ncbi:hypothetical protein OLMES_0475 [Oleiphilus messinensis]|uniref:Lipoprotein n=2 Tax=Oleiphilus messinensis TaxID=141451 RepID=A0A1Y0I2Z4_9GAMM|nr:hypothetical protein OLMES_0475 [Oleiphilus messinensis]
MRLTQFLPFVFATILTACSSTSEVVSTPDSMAEPLPAEQTDATSEPRQQDQCTLYPDHEQCLDQNKSDDDDMKRLR